MTEIVGRGASADVIAWGPGRVAKVFHARYAYAVELEFERARAVHALGAPCPEVFDRIEHDGRPGIVFERVDGPLLLDALRDRSVSAAEVGPRLADLQRSLHGLLVPAESQLPRLVDSIGRWIARWPEAEREAARAELARIRDDPGLCHMDLHPGNVIVSDERLCVVDWVNACAGPLALDVARSFVLMAYQGAMRRDGAYQLGRLQLAEHYRAAAIARGGVSTAELERALGFAADAVLRAEPQNPFAAELRSATPWR